MTLPNLKKIEINVYADRQIHFYNGLIQYSSTKTIDQETLKKFFESIHIDQNLNEIDLFSYKRIRILRKMFAIHEYLCDAHKDSRDYLAVSKNTTKEFVHSEFGQVLYAFILFFEISKQLLGKENALETGMFTASISELLSLLVLIHREIKNKEKANSSLIMERIQKNIIKYLETQTTITEEIEYRDKIIIYLYDILKEYYPNTTLHTATTISGFICSQMRLLDTRDQHILSDKKQSYRKYLRGTVYNVLKKHYLI